MEHLLPGGGKGGDGATVEAVYQRDNGGAVLGVAVHAVLPCRLDGTLVCLSAGIGKEHPVGTTVFYQYLCQPRLILNIKYIRTMGQFFHLVLQFLHQPGITVTQTVNRNAGKKVLIFSALGVL